MASFPISPEGFLDVDRFFNFLEQTGAKPSKKTDTQ